jgi:Zn finger protein HypA/HybF involved in hydrogenase expression
MVFSKVLIYKNIYNILNVIKRNIVTLCLYKKLTFFWLSIGEFDLINDFSVVFLFSVKSFNFLVLLNKLYFQLSHCVDDEVRVIEDSNSIICPMCITTEVSSGEI